MNTADRMDTAAIAAYLQVGQRHVTDRLSKRLDFPKPTINISRRTRYWDRAAIEAWAKGPKR